MNPVFRRTLPPSVRSLLTDISPKEEWTESEPENTSRDGILLPSRSATQEEFLTPARNDKEEEEEERGGKRRAVCMLCKTKSASYTCPRCNLQYCGLSCYQSPDHSACSEEFYKESVLQELKDMGKTEAEGRKKMQEILLGLRQKAEGSLGGFESVLKEAGVVQDDEGGKEAAEKVQVMELLSRLAELQQSGEERKDEVEAILRKLEEIGAGQPLFGDTGEEEEGEEEELDIRERLLGLDLNKLSEEELWELLNSKEKENFMGLMKKGALGGLIPLWKPWWEEHDGEGRALVEVLEGEVNKLEGQTTSALERDDVRVDGESTTENRPKKFKSVSNVRNVEGSRKETKTSELSSPVKDTPPISAKIPKLSSLCANPSPLVRYSLVNTLFGYAFSLCLFNGDTDSLMLEFCDIILALCESLSSNKVFNSVQEALDCGEALVFSGGYFDKEDSLAPNRAIEAVAHILTGRDRKDVTGYCLAALSQLRSTLSKAKTTLSKDGEQGTKRQKFFLASKKCEFFQAWVLDNPQQIRGVAVELWSEHSRRESVRTKMDKERIVVEENLKKQRRKGEMIKELS